MAQQHQDPNPKPPHTDKDQAQVQKPKPAPQPSEAIAAGLVQLDEHIRTKLKLSGPPGSGLYTLLDNLAVQNLGTPRSAFPTPQTNNPGDYYRQQAPLPGVPGSSPPGPLPPSNQMGQGPQANSSAPLNQ